MLNARRSVRAVLGSALLAAGLAGSTLAGAGPASAVPATYGSCAPIQVIAVRGTTEPGTVGGGLQPLATAVTSGDTRGVLTYGLPYPATSDWVNSANAGITMLAQRLALSAYYCPQQRFVLVGYSQGAWVIGDALAGGGGGYAPQVSPALGAKVAAIVLYGDPRFRAGESYDAGTNKTGVSGVLPREKGGLAAYASRIRSYCDGDDTVCQSGATGQGHFGYWTTYTANAAAFVLAKLR